MRSAIVAAAIWLGLAGAAAGQTAAPPAQGAKVITLKSHDGSTQLRGELLGFEGGRYTLRTALGVLAVDALQVECLGEACPVDPLFGAKFDITGSNTIGAALMPALIQGYADTLTADLVRQPTSTPNETVLRVVNLDGREMAAITLKAHGSGEAAAALAAGAPIGMASRELRDAEVQTLAAAGLPDPRGTDREIVLALDGLLVLVHPDNPISSLSVAQIAALFSGGITNWSAVGGPDLPVTLYARDANSGTFDTFESLVLAPAGVTLSPAAKRFEDSDLLSGGVAGDRGGIGVVGAAFAGAARVVPVRLDCGILTRPNSFALKTEEYPLSRRLYLYTRPEGMAPHAKGLLDFATSDAAQALITESGYIDNRPEQRTLAEQGERLIATLRGEEEFSLPLMREMLADLGGAERLSTTFRFTPGSARLDPKSARAAVALARFLADGGYPDREVLLVGFTDSVGDFGLNQGLGYRRALAVLDVLRASVAPGALDRAPILARGYGELTPVGCNTSFEGRLSNRRVEVWLRPLVR